MELDTITHADALSYLKSLPDESVNLIVTSPPYYSLRDYGTAKWEGGDPTCDHMVGRFTTPASDKQMSNAGSGVAQARDVCPKCGARRVDSQIGLEATPAEFVAALVAVFAEVKRVLRADGNAYVNLGDSYSTGSLPGANILDGLHASIKEGVLFFGARCTLTISAQGDGVLNPDKLTPDSKFTRFLGVKRVLLKQRNDDFGQVLNWLNTEVDCFTSSSVCALITDDATLEIVVNAQDCIRVIASDLKNDAESALGVPIGASSAKSMDMSLAVKEAAEPVTKGVGNVQPIGDTLALNPTGESILNANAINNPVSFRDGLALNAGGLRDFSVSEASDQHLHLALMNGIVSLEVRCVPHLLISNAYGSLVRYEQLYAQASELASELQAKQELGVPELFKRAMMKANWICRETIIWHKPAPMPESVRDRCTRAHEYIFHFVKQPRYWYDQQAIAEEAVGGGGGDFIAAHETVQPEHGGISRTGNWSRNGNGRAAMQTRNRRSVWTVNPSGFPGSHFAVFPEKLIEPIILAACPEWCCEKCGAPYEAQVENKSIKDHDGKTATAYPKGSAANRLALLRQAAREQGGEYSNAKVVTGYAPSCTCNAGKRAGVVLDPFMGAGTTALVAKRLNRRYLGCDLNGDYVRMAEQRIDSIPYTLFSLMEANGD